MNNPTDDFWPASLRHLAKPFVTDTDEEIVVGEVTSQGRSPGVRFLFTALVAPEDVDAALKAPGGIGQGVRCNGPRPTVGPEGGYSPSFSIHGPADSSKTYESLIQTWRVNNKIVVLPDNGFLMCYGLVPRPFQDGSTSWDDLSEPVYDVVRIRPLSNYSDNSYTSARITIARDYLEDYLSLRNRVAIATYFEERYSSGDTEIEPFLGKSFKLPGRTLWFYRMAVDEGNQLSQVWGSALLLAPKCRPISDDEEIELTWPDWEKPIKGDGRGAGLHMENFYVRDDVLIEYEKRDEFDINPESGSVAYDSWWSVGYCHRYSRNYIVAELRKLYEGAPVYVIKHFNKYAAKREVAENDREIEGSRHIGDRARDLILRILGTHRKPIPGFRRGRTTFDTARFWSLRHR
jgi:hypothetical protein